MCSSDLLTGKSERCTLASMKDDDFRDRPEHEDAYPRAPSQEEWDAMTPEERVRVEKSLPGVVTWDEMALPEGGKHSLAERQREEAERRLAELQRTLKRPPGQR